MPARRLCLNEACCSNAAMDDEHVLRLLRAACKNAGSQAQWAREHGVAQQYISAVLNRRRAPGPQVLAALGLERITTRIANYVRAKERA
jgi:hypothetical protein